MKGNMTRKLGALAALAMLALIGAGCSNDSDDTGTGNDAAANQTQAVKFAECMRDNGVSEFPDPDASGGLTIDGVVNGSKLDPSSAAWETAIAACKELQPSGFTGDGERSPEEQEAALAFAQCMRDNGVEDFPDPTVDGPLIDTSRMPGAPGALSIPGFEQAQQACGDIIAGQLDR
jgi:hypothetical protein